MSNQAKKRMGLGGGLVVLAAAIFFLLGNRPGDIPVLGAVLDPEPPTCPLSGVEPRKESVLDRPAVAVKIENSSVAYPLAGLERAEIVYEELVEGGVTRFMALYHCTDASKAGPVRSARMVDPAIMAPLTRILGYSGENDHVQRALEEADIVRLDEDSGGSGLVRIERPGISFEHTLYANTSILRRLGRKSYADAPPDDVFEFGDIEGSTRKAGEVTINFSSAGTLRYVWSEDGWLRFEGDTPFVDESGSQITVTNVLIEEHDVNLSSITDVAGNPSIEIADVTGEGRAVLFRDGRAIKGRWIREDVDDAVRFVTKSGDTMKFAAGSIWIHLVPSSRGEVKGSFSFAK
ncbi:MAG TPA: DUF3048 domain-containing protein [Actinomycetota bacterium]|nr:DUF3048 domain-containing protein [Actinomycetota bacterium]